jgi:hypothetical protein
MDGQADAAKVCLHRSNKGIPVMKRAERRLQTTEAALAKASLLGAARVSLSQSAQIATSVIAVKA